MEHAYETLTLMKLGITIVTGQQNITALNLRCSLLPYSASVLIIYIYNHIYGEHGTFQATHLPLKPASQLYTT